METSNVVSEFKTTIYFIYSFRDAMIHRRWIMQLLKFSLCFSPFDRHLVMRQTKTYNKGQRQSYISKTYYNKLITKLISWWSLSKFPESEIWQSFCFSSRTWVSVKPIEPSRTFWPTSSWATRWSRTCWTSRPSTLSTSPTKQSG